MSAFRDPFGEAPRSAACSRLGSAHSYLGEQKAAAI